VSLARLAAANIAILMPYFRTVFTAEAAAFALLT
jgi:hypothetical protein